MKKQIIKGTAVLFASAMFVGCSQEDDLFDESGIVDNIKNEYGLRQHRRQVIAIASLMAVTSFLKAFQSWIIGIAYYGAIHDFLDYHIYYRQRYNKPFLRDVLNKKRTLQLLISSKIAPPPCA